MTAAIVRSYVKLAAPYCQGFNSRLMQFQWGRVYFEIQSRSGIRIQSRSHKKPSTSIIVLHEKKERIKINAGHRAGRNKLKQIEKNCALLVSGRESDCKMFSKTRLFLQNNDSARARARAHRCQINYSNVYYICYFFCREE